MAGAADGHFPLLGSFAGKEKLIAGGGCFVGRTAARCAVSILVGQPCDGLGSATGAAVVV